MKSIRNYFTSFKKGDETDGDLPPSKKVKVVEEVRPAPSTVSLAQSDALSEVLKSGDEEVGGEVVAPQVESVNWSPMDSMETSWRQRLVKEYRKPYFQSLMRFLASENQKSAIVYPPSHQIFTALNLCPYDEVKVVIIGQDPYHGPGQAHGLAFSVQKGVPLPPSLKNMVSELQNDPATKIRAPSHGNLECWSKQGVLMLNTCLTVRKGEANSHQKHGWEEFTDAIVKELSKKEGLVYLLWGKPAQTKCAGIDHKKNKVLTSSHPSPLSAYKTNEPFIGSRIFSRCNDALAALGKPPIDWSIVD